MDDFPVTWGVFQAFLLLHWALGEETAGKKLLENTRFYCYYHRPVKGRGTGNGREPSKE